MSLFTFGLLQETTSQPIFNYTKNFRYIVRLAFLDVNLYCDSRLSLVVRLFLLLFLLLFFL